MNQQIFQAINSSQLFRTFTTDEKRRLTEVVVERKYEENQIVFSYEHTGKYFYLIKEGTVTLRLKNGKIKKYYAGDGFGEVAIFNKSYRTGRIQTDCKATLLGFHHSLLTEETVLPPQLALKLSNTLSVQVVQYLQDSTQIPTAEIIEKGENDRIEFKASLSKRSAESVIRTVVAFLNSSGGTLFIGVDDYKKIVGINGFSYKDIDNYWNSFTACIQNRVEPCFSQHISMDIEEVQGKRIVRIDCTPAHKPALLTMVGVEENDRKDIFLIRTGPKNIELKNKRQMIDYIRDHFCDKGKRKH